MVSVVNVVSVASVVSVVNVVSVASVVSVVSVVGVVVRQRIHHIFVKWFCSQVNIVLNDFISQQVSDHVNFIIFI